MLRHVLGSLGTLLLVAGCGPDSPEPPKPADGGDLTACSDGLCEVSAPVGGKMTLPERTRVRSVTVQSIEGDIVALIARGIGPRQGGSCTGKRCEASAKGSDFKAMLGPGSGVTYNDLAIDLLGIGDGAAILRIKPL
ncbi:hypothetical protein HDA45_001490 [Amycolatopsis umgeniensis]|uniref:Lipoprotein n=1 Tax=Amycolatopsis umgeniensis TaxID=336628 RepID=A0A841AWX9_9PSEU|nr:hypothetical protein [Amycolatopsis umgeniensis]